MTQGKVAGGGERNTQKNQASNIKGTAKFIDKPNIFHPEEVWGMKSGSQ